MISTLKHAGPETIDRLEPLLAELRLIAGLVEKKPGVFYKKSRAFIHFHDDATGIHADVRLHEDFERRRVETAKERSAFLKEVRSSR
jgi:hypothetical protein